MNTFAAIVSTKSFALFLACNISYLAASLSTNARGADLGEFTARCDVGEPEIHGSTDYDAATQSYTLTGSGANMWFDTDEFHFAYKRIQGDFIVRARARFLGQGVDPHRKMGWIVRSSLNADSPHANAVVHGDGLTSLQFRRQTGGPTEEARSPLTSADVIQLERRGDLYTMSVARFGEPFVVTRCDEVDLEDEVYVGLFVCSHNSEVAEKAVFENVRVTIPASEGFVPYRDYIGSRLETLDVDSGIRHVLFRTKEGIEAPNWLPDGNALLYNSRGRLFRFSFADRSPSPLDTGFATRCNNDHVLSFDGQTLGISHHAEQDGGKSVIYTLPAAGGDPHRVTSKVPSYLHGWSPDGKYLIYTGQRDDEFDIYRIPVGGGDETRLTTAKGLDDGSEYSPDGEYIYFNSARTGTMQLWRMRPDGSEQEQLTDDELNDWFPHPSPDGTRIVFLSFSKEVAAEDHPFYQQIYLRMIPAAGGEPKIIAYAYGGQGTINVPSWAPDSRRVAFVSHTDE